MNKLFKCFFIGAAISAISGCAVFSGEKKEAPQPSTPAVIQQQTQARPSLMPEIKKSVFKASDKVPLEAWLQYKLKVTAEENDIPYALALAVIEQESSFDPAARNANCYGLMQVSTVHVPNVGILLDPIENIRYGCRLLGMLHKQYRSWAKALTAYNYGETGMSSKETSGYAREVLFKSEKWAKALGEKSVLYTDKKLVGNSQ